MFATWHDYRAIWRTDQANSEDTGAGLETHTTAGLETGATTTEKIYRFRAAHSLDSGGGAARIRG
jgi:hypothetical protein